MSQNSPEERPQGPKSQLPVVIGSFVTGVAAMTLVGVLAPAMATARAPDPNAAREQGFQFQGSPMALTEVTEAQRAEIDRRLEAAQRTLEEARAETDRAVARLDQHATRG
ncbi:MAG: hypothetical protein AB7J28_15980 [Hyphomonadaceae bacterium]